MKNSILLSILIITTTSIAQVNIKKPVAPYFDKVPTIFSTVDGAYAGLKYNDSRGVFDPAPASSALRTELETLMKEIAAKSVAVTVGANSKNQAQIHQEVQSPDFQKKMQSMSQEEQIKWAMQTQSQVTGNTNQREDMEITNIMMDISQSYSSGLYQKLQAMQGETRGLEDKSSKDHQAINDWQKAELSKLPTMPTEGGLVYKDSKKAIEIVVQNFQKHLAKQNEILKMQQAILTKYTLAFKPNVGKMDGYAATTDYGDKCKDVNNNTLIKGKQSEGINYVLELLSYSDESGKKAAEWKRRSENYNKEKYAPIQGMIVE